MSSKLLTEYDVQVAVVSSEAERHCDLAVRAAAAGVHVVQDKPMSTRVSECDRVIEAVEQAGVQFMMWNRNLLPGVLHAKELIEEGTVGDLRAIHVDFYFAKDAGPTKGSRARPTSRRSTGSKLRRQPTSTAPDGGVGTEPMGELKIEGIYPPGLPANVNWRRSLPVLFARTTAHFHQLPRR